MTDRVAVFLGILAVAVALGVWNYPVIVKVTAENWVKGRLEALCETAVHRRNARVSVSEPLTAYCTLRAHKARERAENRYLDMQ